MPDSNERGGAMTGQRAMTATDMRRRNSGSIIVAEAAARADRHRPLLAAADFAAAFVDSGEAVVARLGTDWSVAAVIIDTTLLTANLLERLRRPGSPRLIVLVDDADADAAGLALDANLADFVASDVADGDYIAAIELALDDAPTRRVAMDAESMKTLTEEAATPTRRPPGPPPRPKANTPKAPEPAPAPRNETAPGLRAVRPPPRGRIPASGKGAPSRPPPDKERPQGSGK